MRTLMGHDLYLNVLRICCRKYGGSWGKPFFYVFWTRMASRGGGRFRGRHLSPFGEDGLGGCGLNSVACVPRAWRFTGCRRKDTFPPLTFAPVRLSSACQYSFLNNNVATRAVQRLYADSQIPAAHRYTRLAASFLGAPVHPAAHRPFFALVLSGRLGGRGAETSGPVPGSGCPSRRKAIFTPSTWPSP